MFIFDVLKLILKVANIRFCGCFQGDATCRFRHWYFFLKNDADGTKICSDWTASFVRFWRYFPLENWFRNRPIWGRHRLLSGGSDALTVSQRNKLATIELYHWLISLTYLHSSRRRRRRSFHWTPAEAARRIGRHDASASATAASNGRFVSRLFFFFRQHVGKIVGSRTHWPRGPLTVANSLQSEHLWPIERAIATASSVWAPKIQSQLGARRSIHAPNSTDDNSNRFLQFGRHSTLHRPPKFDTEDGKVSAANRHKQSRPHLSNWRPHETTAATWLNSTIEIAVCHAALSIFPFLFLKPSNSIADCLNEFIHLLTLLDNQLIYIKNQSTIGIQE